jgi:hypothetical protein
VQFAGRSYDFTIGGGGSSGFGIFSDDMLRMAKLR